MVIQFTTKIIYIYILRERERGRERERKRDMGPVAIPKLIFYPTIHMKPEGG